MRKEELLKYEGKRVFLELKGRLFYTCVIIKVNEDSVDIFDKFNLTSTHNIDKIESISEIKKEEGDGHE